MSPPYRAIFFDAAHTLLEPARPVKQVYLEVAADLGVALDADLFGARLSEAWRSLRAVPADPSSLATSEAAEARRWWELTRAVAESFPPLLSLHETWLARLVARFEDPTSWRALPGVSELLARLAGDGLVLGVISNWNRALPPILEALQLDRSLRFVLVSSEVGWRKPHPRIFTEALTRSGVASQRALHVGDSPEEDIAGASACGIDSVLVGRAARDNGNKATFTLEQTADLEQLW